MILTMRRKSLGPGPTVGATTSPKGVRWHPHRRVRVGRDEQETSAAP